MCVWVCLGVVVCSRTIGCHGFELVRETYLRTGGAFPGGRGRGRATVCVLWSCRLVQRVFWSSPASASGCPCSLRRFSSHPYSYRRRNDRSLFTPEHSTSLDLRAHTLGVCLCHLYGATQPPTLPTLLMALLPLLLLLLLLPPCSPAPPPPPFIYFAPILIVDG